MADQKTEIARLVSIIRNATICDSAYRNAEQELIRLGEAAVPALTGLAAGSDKMISARAKEILLMIPPP